MTETFAGQWGTWEATPPSGRLGHPLRVYDTLGSTNDQLRELAVAGAEEGTTVVAKEQTSGRGRQGRPWVSARELGLYLSVLLRPALSARETGWLAVLGGVGVARALEGLGLEGVAIKWPNDVLVHGRKMAGVLVEPLLSHGQVEFTVLGLGVNVLHERQDFPAELAEAATSLRLEGVAVPVQDLGPSVLTELDTCYGWMAGGTDGRARLLAAWQERGGLDLLPEIA